MIGERLVPFQDTLRQLRQQQQVRVRRQPPAPPPTSSIRRVAGPVAVCVAVLLGLAGTVVIAYDVFVMGTLATWETAFGSVSSCSSSLW